MRLETSDGRLISSVDAWFRLAPPKRGERQWHDGRSAKELAKSWFRNGSAAPPQEFVSLLRSHQLTHDLKVESGIPEYVTPIDQYRGEGRNNDMVLVCSSGGARVVATVEAKADESFGPIVSCYFKMKRSYKSNARKRVSGLLAALFGPALQANDCKLRYQLIHASAASLIEARRRDAKLAILVIHEFVKPSATDPRRLERNAKDFEAFLRGLLPGGTAWQSGGLVGPINVRGGVVPSDVPLLVGKVTTPLS